LLTRPIHLPSAAAAHLFRCPSEEAVGKPLDRFIPEPFRYSHAEDIRRFGETGGTVRSMGSLRALRALRADGTEISIEASISTTKVSDRTIYTVILRDITARQAAEDALRESEARFRGTFENMPLEWALRHSMAPGSRSTTDSARSAVILARNFLPEVSKTPRILTDLDDMGRLLAEEIPHYTMDKRYIRKDGSIVWVGLTASLQRDASGAPLYCQDPARYHRA
jgi:PAS domain S-box-containing protein